MRKHLAFSAVAILLTAAAWVVLDRRAKESAVIVDADSLTPPPRVAAADNIEAPELPTQPITDRRSPVMTWSAESPEAFALAIGETRVINFNSSGKAKVTLHSESPVTAGFTNKYSSDASGNLTPDLTGACGRVSFTAAEFVCDVNPQTALVIADARGARAVTGALIGVIARQTAPVQAAIADNRISLRSSIYACSKNC